MIYVLPETQEFYLTGTDEDSKKVLLCLGLGYYWHVNVGNFILPPANYDAQDYCDYGESCWEGGKNGTDEFSYR